MIHSFLDLPNRYVWAPIQYAGCNLSSAVPCLLSQQFSTGVPLEYLKHAIPDHEVRDTDLFSLRLPNKKLTIASKAIAIWCEWIKIILVYFLSDWQKVYFLMCCRILVISLCVSWDEKGSKSLLWVAYLQQKVQPSPDKCGSVGWALSCKAKAWQLDYGSGHMPGFWVQSPGTHMSRNSSMFLSNVNMSLPFFPPVLPLTRKINTIFLKRKFSSEYKDN